MFGHLYFVKLALSFTKLHRKIVSDYMKWKFRDAEESSRSSNIHLINVLEEESR